MPVLERRSPKAAPPPPPRARPRPRPPRPRGPSPRAYSEASVHVSKGLWKSDMVGRLPPGPLLRFLSEPTVRSRKAAFSSQPTFILALRGARKTSMASTLIVVGCDDVPFSLALAVRGCWVEVPVGRSGGSAGPLRLPVLGRGLSMALVGSSGWRRSGSSSGSLPALV
jgi:hypothetical protein